MCRISNKDKTADSNVMSLVVNSIYKSDIIEKNKFVKSSNFSKRKVSILIVIRKYFDYIQKNPRKNSKSFLAQFLNCKRCKCQKSMPSMSPNRVSIWTFGEHIKKHEKRTGVNAKGYIMNHILQNWDQIDDEMRIIIFIYFLVKRRKQTFL